MGQEGWRERCRQLHMAAQGKESRIATAAAGIALLTSEAHSTPELDLSLPPALLTPVINLDGGGGTGPCQAEDGPELAVRGGARRLARERASKGGKLRGRSACSSRNSKQMESLLLPPTRRPGRLAGQCGGAASQAMGRRAVVLPPASRKAGVLTPPEQLGQGRRKKARAPTMLPGAFALYDQAAQPDVLALQGRRGTGGAFAAAASQQVPPQNRLPPPAPLPAPPHTHTTRVPAHLMPTCSSPPSIL